MKQFWMQIMGLTTFNTQMVHEMFSYEKKTIVRKYKYGY